MSELPSVIDQVKHTDRRLLFSFVAAVFIFGLLASRTEINANNVEKALKQTQQIIHDKAVSDWKQCQRTVVNTTKINSTNQAFIDFLRPLIAKSPNPKPLVDFIHIYEEAKLDVPVCGPRP